MNVDVYGLKGKATGKVSLPESYFKANLNTPLMTQAVNVYLFNQRSAHAKTKTRGEVSLTKAKWFRQKGTGRARHGAKSAPIFVGGGVAHGPTGSQNWKRKLPLLMKRQALAAALSLKLKKGEITIVEDLKKLSGKTKEAADFILAFPAKQEKKKFLVVLDKKDEILARAFRNIRKIRLMLIKNLSTYDVMNGGEIFISKEAIESLSKNK